MMGFGGRSVVPRAVVLVGVGAAADEAVMLPLAMEASVSSVSVVLKLWEARLMLMPTVSLCASTHQDRSLSQ